MEGNVKRKYPKLYSDISEYFCTRIDGPKENSEYLGLCSFISSFHFHNRILIIMDMPIYKALMFLNFLCFLLDTEINDIYTYLHAWLWPRLNRSTDCSIFCWLSAANASNQHLPIIIWGNCPENQYHNQQLSISLQTILMSRYLHVYVYVTPVRWRTMWYSFNLVRCSGGSQILAFTTWFA